MLISGFKGFSVSSALYQSEFSSTMNKLYFFVPPADGLHCLDSHCLCHQVSFFFFSRWESQNRHYKYSDSYRRFALNKINCILHLPPKMSLWQGRPRNSIYLLNDFCTRMIIRQEMLDVPLCWSVLPVAGISI